jgi:hypothetical protein
MKPDWHDDDDTASSLAMLGTKLLQGGRTKDGLMKLLKVPWIGSRQCVPIR